MVNRAFLGQMKPSAYLINISRGGVVDQDALVEALRERRIAGAGLDVFTPEPLAPGHPLTDPRQRRAHPARGRGDARRLPHEDAVRDGQHPARRPGRAAARARPRHLTGGRGDRPAIARRHPGPARRGLPRGRGRRRARVRDRARHAAGRRLGGGRARERPGPDDRPHRGQPLARVVEPGRARLARDRRLPPGRGAARGDRRGAVHGDPARVALAPHGTRAALGAPAPAVARAGSPADAPPALPAARRGDRSPVGPRGRHRPRHHAFLPRLRAPPRAPTWGPTPCARPGSTSSRRSCTAATPS